MKKINKLYLTKSVDSSLNFHRFRQAAHKKLKANFANVCIKRNLTSAALIIKWYPV